MIKIPRIDQKALEPEMSRVTGEDCIDNIQT